MPYPELMIRPMREELTRLGVEEARTPEQVDAAVQNTPGTLLVVVNSVCGCAAGKARPGIAMALQNEKRPDRAITVFAGADIDATEQARSYFKGYYPSSPAVAILRNGQVEYMMERRDIETKSASQIAQELSAAFERVSSTVHVAS